MLPSRRIHVFARGRLRSQACSSRPRSPRSPRILPMPSLGRPPLPSKSRRDPPTRACLLTTMLTLAPIHILAAGPGRNPTASNLPRVVARVRTRVPNLAGESGRDFRACPPLLTTMLVFACVCHPRKALMTPTSRQRLLDSVAATQLQTLGCNGHRVQSPGPRGMGWPSGFAGPANALRAKEAGDGF